MEGGALNYLAPLADALIVALLVATIVYATILNRKLSALREAKQEMERLVGGLTAALAQAEGGLAELKRAAEQTGGALQQAVGKGNALADDLVFLIDRAGTLANRLERQAAAPRRTAGGPPGKASGSAVETGTEAEARGVERRRSRSNRTPEQRALLEALRGVR